MQVKKNIPKEYIIHHHYKVESFCSMNPCQRKSGVELWTKEFEIKTIEH
jgi:hypothetical protein